MVSSCSVIKGSIPTVGTSLSCFGVINLTFLITLFISSLMAFFSHSRAELTIFSADTKPNPLIFDNWAGVLLASCAIVQIPAFFNLYSADAPTPFTKVRSSLNTNFMVGTESSRPELIDSNFSIQSASLFCSACAIPMEI